MLLLAGIEWVFFRVIRMGLWFGFVLRRVLIVQGIFLAGLAWSQDLFCSSFHSISEWAVSEFMGNWEGT